MRPVSHRPPDYRCPFCFLLTGGETETDSPHDIVLRTERATALIASWWWQANPGNVIVIPNAHFENLYDLPAEFGHAVHDVVREVAIAMRAEYDCAGITTRQHNEPVGGQDVWHYHVHVVPRFPDDGFYGTAPAQRFTPRPRRQPYVDRLRGRLGS